MDNIRQERLITQSFAVRGLILRKEAISFLQQAASKDVTELNEKTLKDFVVKLINWIEKQQLESTAIDKRICEQAIESLYKDAAGEQHVSLLDILDVFRNARSKLGVSNNFDVSFGTASSKSLVFRDRYSCVFDRLSRHELFTVQPSDQDEEKFRLRKLEFLMQYRSLDEEALLKNVKLAQSLRNVVFAGVLSQLRDGEWFLEDDTGVIALDLSGVEWQASLVTESCVVLVEGTIRNDRLIASAIGLPPVAVAASKQLAIDTENGRRLAMLERANSDCMFLFLANVHLDDARTLSKLRTLFSGYEQADPIPYCFVMSGDFLATYRLHGAAFEAHSHTDAQLLDAHTNSSNAFLSDFVALLERALTRFGQLVKRVAPRIAAESHFVILPGPLDPTRDGGGSPFGRGRIVPRAALLERCGAALRGHLANVHLVSNPCVLRYATQRIFVVRDALIEKMMQACICKPRLKSVFSAGDRSETASMATGTESEKQTETETGNSGDLMVEKKIGEQYLRTVLSQQYAAPLPLHYHSVRWPLGSAFALDPVPDLIVCATSRKLRDFTCRNETADVQLLNPGSFSEQGFTFKAYYPANKQIEDCRLPD